jgi:C1A family cysteine protease
MLILTSAKISLAQLPFPWDWNEIGKVTPVKNQGSPCSSDWVFAAVAAVESKIMILSGLQMDISEQQILSSCGASSGDGNGGAPANASLLDITTFAQNFGKNACL